MLPELGQTDLLAFNNNFFKKAEDPSNDIELHQYELKCEPCTFRSENQLEVCLKNAHKSYGTIKPFVVLDGLDMTVPKGTIYGLLGASGCGKTTLLNCIIGRKRLNSGQIWVLGGTPGSRNSGAPGPRIGYMPQETGLYGEFSIRETFLFFGRVVGMTKSAIMERYNFLVKLLMLPDGEEAIKTLSGGQQRRVSLAVALLHEPELLILDEPTVGVDPLLRHLIWEHLLEIAKRGNTTIIITTHYIEEARQADIIGLMRGGYFLAEEPPEKLMLQHNAQTLEEVFLKLSTVQNLKSRSLHSITHGSSNSIEVSNGVTNRSAPSANTQSEKIGKTCETTEGNEKENEIHNAHAETTQSEFVANTLHQLRVFKRSHMRALILKNLLWLSRNKPIILFITFLPVVLVILFCTFIGRDPINLPVAVVNYERNTKNCDNNLTCDSSQLSCSYLGYLERRSLILTYYDSEREAIQSVITGDTFASITIRHNYSEALRARVKDWQNSDPWDLAYSEIEVVRDPSNKHIANYLKVYLFESFQTFIQDYVETCGIHRKVLTLPIKWETPVYGPIHPNFTDYAIPGILLSISFFVALSLTAGAMLIERNEASLERTLVTGINEIELLTAHIICELGIMLTQSALAMISAFVVFNMTLKGSILLVAILLLLTGFCGMCYGLFISCICDRDMTTTLLATGSLIPMLVMCGVIWPIDAMHRFLKPVAYILPLTYPTESMRCILQKNWGLDSKSVYIGFITINIWTVIFLVISIVLLKIKRD